MTAEMILRVGFGMIAVSVLAMAVGLPRVSMVVAGITLLLVGAFVITAAFRG